MNYGQALEAIKKGEVARRATDPDSLVFLEEPGSPLQYLRRASPNGLVPFVPSVDDQLAEDWQVAA